MSEVFDQCGVVSVLARAVQTPRERIVYCPMCTGTHPDVLQPLKCRLGVHRLLPITDKRLAPCLRFAAFPAGLSLEQTRLEQPDVCRFVNPPVWSISSTPQSHSCKPHSFRDEYWLRRNKPASNASPDGSSSLHTQFQAYVEDNADRLDIAGRPPMPSQIDLALSMERQWEEVCSNCPRLW